VKVICDRAALAEALACVCRAASSRSSVRVLAGVRVAADQKGLMLAATDLEMAISASAAAHVDEEGLAVAPARTLLAVVQALDGDEVELSASEAALTICCGDSQYRLRTLSVEDFPNLPSLDGATRIALPYAVLAGTVARVLRAAATDLSRPVYTGVRIAIDGDVLLVTATDGYRLASARTELAGEAEQLDVLVPARALGEVMRITRGAQVVDMAVTANVIRFGVPGFEITARTLDGRPPDHEHILAAPFAHRARLQRTNLLRAVDRAALLADRGSAVELAFDDGELRVRARSAELGDGDERVTAEPGGPTLRVGFNARYLREGLDLVEGDEVWFELNDAIRPVVLRGPREDFAYLMAPLRLPE
jgi:DNA polymerase-3 subunit beta